MKTPQAVVVFGSILLVPALSIRDESYKEIDMNGDFESNSWLRYQMMESTEQIHETIVDSIKCIKESGINSSLSNFKQSLIIESVLRLLERKE
jgi:hypothetical protein